MQIAKKGSIDKLFVLYIFYCFELKYETFLELFSAHRFLNKWRKARAKISPRKKDEVVVLICGRLKNGPKDSMS